MLIRPGLILDVTRTILDCPDDSELAAFAAGRISTEDSSSIEHHLACCLVCQSRFDAAALHGDSLIGKLRKAAEVAAPDLKPALVDRTQGWRIRSDGNHAAATGLLANRYRLGEFIAAGGMGEVYRAVDVVFDREVAVKRLLPEHAGDQDASQRFRNEAALTAQLQHPGIPPMYDLGVGVNGDPFLAMKLIAGRTLKGLLQERGRPSDDLPRFLSIFEQIASAVGYAHAQGVIHRDLKPANVMVGEFGEVQVMDWGLAKQIGQAETPRPSTGALADDLFERTLDGQVMGTLAYMAPEQARGEISTLDARADVFALGAILLQILEGGRVYEGKNHGQVLTQAQAGDVGAALDRLKRSGVDEDLIALTTECLRGHAAGRPAHGAAVAARIASYRALVEERLRKSEATRAATEARAQEQTKRRRLFTLGVAALAVVLAIGAGMSTMFAIRASAEAKRATDAGVEKEKEATKAKQSQAEAERQLSRLKTDKGARLWEERDALGAATWFASAIRSDDPRDPDDEANRIRVGMILKSSPKVLAAWDKPVSCSKFGGRRLMVRTRQAEIWEDELWEVDGQVARVSLPLEDGERLEDISGDGRFVLTIVATEGADEGRPRVWDVDSAQVVCEGPYAAQYSLKARFSPDARFVAAQGSSDSAGGGKQHVMFEVSPTGDEVEPTPLILPTDASLAEPQGESWVGGGRFTRDSRRYVLTAEAATENGEMRLATRVWDLRTRTPVGAETVTANLFAYVDTTIVAGGKTLQILNVETGESLTIAPEDPDARFVSSSVRIGPDGNHIAVLSSSTQGSAAGPRHDIAVYELATAKRLFSKHLDGAAGRAPSVLAGYSSSHMALLDVVSTRVSLHKWTERADIQETEIPVFGLPRDAVFSPDGQRLAVVESGGQATIWAVDERHAATPLAYVRSTPGGFHFSPDGQYAMFGDQLFGFLPRPSMRTNAESFRPEKTRQQRSIDRTKAVQWEPGGPTLLLDFMASDGPVANLPRDAGSLANLSTFVVNASRDLLATVCGPAEFYSKAGRVEVRLWRLPQATCVADEPADELTSLLTLENSALESIVFSPDGHRLLTVTRAGDDLENGTKREYRVDVWDARSGKPLLQEWKLTGSRSRSFATFREANGSVVFAAADVLEERDLAAGKVIAQYTPTGSVIRAIHATGKVLLDAGETATLVDFSGKQIGAAMETKHVLQASFSEDGARVTTQSMDIQLGLMNGQFRVWDAKTGEPISRPFVGGGETPALSPDGRYFAFKDDSDRLCVLEFASGHPLVSRQPIGFHDLLAFTQGSNFVSIIEDGRRSVLDLRPGTLAADSLREIVAARSMLRIDRTETLSLVSRAEAKLLVEKLRRIAPEQVSLSDFERAAWRRQEIAACQENSNRFGQRLLELSARGVFPGSPQFQEEIKLKADEEDE